MSEKTKKQYGVWMDTHHAIIIGHYPDALALTVVGRAKNPGAGSNSNENAANNLEVTLAHKYFKEIGSQMLNADEVHIIGSGTIQEQLMHYLAETPKFKKTKVSESTCEPMSDEKLVEFFASHFN